VTEERIVPAREPSESAVLPDVPATSALGRDPFEEETGIDPILECLDALEGEPTRGTAKRASAGRSAAERIEATAVGRAGRAAARARRRAARRSPRRRSLAIPALREIELPKPRGWLDWFAPDDERRSTAPTSASRARGTIRFPRPAPQSWRATMRGCCPSTPP
jgi:hypothetical protein